MNWIIPISAAIVAYTYNSILITQGHLFYGFHRWLTKIFSWQITEQLPDNTPAEVREMPGYKFKPIYQVKVIHSWILKPLGDCPVCMAGQITLWGILENKFLPLYSIKAHEFARTAGCTITMICTSILLVTILQKFVSRGKR